MNNKVTITFELNNVNILSEIIQLLSNANSAYTISNTTTTKVETKTTPPDKQELLRIIKYQQFKAKDIEILELLCQGNTYNEIAEKAEISIDGVRYYIKKIFKILEVNNARQAIMRFRELKDFS